MAAKKTAKKTAKKSAAKTAKKTAAKSAKKSAAKKTTAKKSTKKAAKSTAKKSPAKKQKPTASKTAKSASATKPTATKPAAAGAGKGGGTRSAEVHMGHLFSLRPRVNMSFKPEDIRTAKQRLEDESYASIPEAARAVADLALEISQGGRPDSRGKLRRW